MKILIRMVTALIFLQASVGRAGGNIPMTFIPVPYPQVKIVNVPTVQTADANNYTFSTVPLDTASTDRLVIVTVHWTDGNSRTLSSATIGGVAATIATNQYLFAASAAIIYAVVPTGTTGNVFLQFSGVVERCQIGVWVARGLMSTTPTATVQNTASSASIAVAHGGFAVAVKTNNATGAIAWTNADVSYNTQPEAGAQASAASTTQSGTVVIGTTNDGTGQVMSAVSWR